MQIDVIQITVSLQSVIYPSKSLFILIQAHLGVISVSPNEA
jgi:hypothetical protein